MSSKKKKQGKKQDFKDAIKAYFQGFGTVNACATHYGVCHSTLGYLIKYDKEYVGGGRTSSVFTQEEESNLVQFVSNRLSVGCGMDFCQLSLIIQELANALKASNPDREFPSSWESNFPHKSYVRRFIKRNNLVLRRTMPLSRARAMLTYSDLDNWYTDISGRFVNNPRFADCFTDPRKMYNQDETPITWGIEHQRVLAIKGHIGPAYNLGGSSREHTTASVIVGADGSVPAVRIVL